MCADYTCMGNLEEDIRDSLTFLSECDWVHNFQVTNIFAKKVVKNLPAEWLDHLQRLGTTELNEVPFMEAASKEMHPDWPLSLHNFICRASALSLDRTQTTDTKPTAIDTGMARGMTPKKLHEVSCMASLVHDIVCKTNCNLVVDVGSGLGYLDHVLHQVYGHPVLGLETSESHTCAAEIRAVNQGLTCSGIKSLKFDITDKEECFQKFENIIHNTALSSNCDHSVKDVLEADEVSKIVTPKVCLIGLHCCGDLSSSVLSMFHHVNYIKAVCCVCCCYHKMAFEDGQFLKFPISQAGQEHYQRVQHNFPSWQLSPFTLRLGAQETRCRWRMLTPNEHANHVRHVAYRGLLEMINFEDSETVRKRVRKCDFSSFETFLKSYFSTCKAPEEVKETVTGALRKLYEVHKEEFDQIETVTCLQVIVQPVLEALVYKDRVQWLMERELTDVQVVPVFNEVISPRNLAIVAIKPS